MKRKLIGALVIIALSVGGVLTGATSCDTTNDELDSVYYKNCTAARDAGAVPIHEGDPGYGRHLDRDGDGVGCDIVK